MFNLNTTRKKTFGLHQNIAILLAALLILGALSSSGPTVTQAQTENENICNFQRDLQIGSRGSDVTCLQTYLKSTGHLSGTVTDYFGPNARQAVISWQQSQEITPAEGYFGSISRNRYESIQGPEQISSTDSTPDTTTASGNENRSALQQQIRGLMLQVIDLLNQLLERRLSEAGIDRSQLSQLTNQESSNSQDGDSNDDDSSSGGGGGGGSSSDGDDDNGGGGGGGSDDGGDDDDTTAPTISNIQATSGTSSATIIWNTDEAADSLVEYGTTNSYGSSESNSVNTTSHSVEITGLSTGTTYHYRVQSTDAADNTRTGSDRTFTTTTDGPNTFLLDNHPGATLATAIFRLSGSYSGPIMRVERSSDNVRADIMPDDNGKTSLSSEVANLSNGGSTTTLSDFSGNDSIYVKRLYDQSGNENDLVSTDDTDHNRILMQNGEFKTDSRGNVSLWSDPEDPDGQTAGRSFKPVTLDPALDLSNFTSIILAEPFYIPGHANLNDPTNPDQTLFMFGQDESVEYFSDDRLFLWGYDGNYRRGRFVVGDGQNPEGTSDSIRLLDFPAIYTIASNNQTIDFQSNDMQKESTSHSVTLPESNTLIPFSGGYSSHNNYPINVTKQDISGLIIYPNYKNGSDRGSIYQKLIEKYNTDTVTEKNEDAILPQFTQDHVILYDWLETLEESDFDIPQSSDTQISYSPSGSASVRDLYATYYGLGDSPRPRRDFLRYPSSAFVLDNGSGEGIEGDSENVRVVTSASGEEGQNMEASFFYEFEEPGVNNPYYQNENLANRLASQAIAMMMSDEYELYFGSPGNYPEWTGMQVMQSMAAFEAAKDGATNLTDKEIAAYYRTVNSVVNYWDKYFAGPKDANTNMDTDMFYGLAILYNGAKEEGLDDIATNARELAAKYLLGSRDATDPGDAPGKLDHYIFHSAGYVGERSQPETSYNGLSLYYLAKAADEVKGISEWSWLWDENGVVDRMARFKALQIFRDPDGQLNGPSGYSVRTNAPYAADQSHSSGRDFQVAEISDYGISVFNKRLNNNVGVTDFSDPSVNDLENTIQNALDNEYGTDAFTQVSANYEELTNGSKRWWPHRISTSPIKNYDPSFYDNITNLLDSNSSTLQLPTKRDANYNTPLGRDGYEPDFWAFKDTDSSGNDFAGFIESFTSKDTRYSSWRGGGTIQSFWTENTGLVINSRSSSHGNEALDWPAVDTWATHHVWGQLGDDTNFSSAQRDSRTSSYSYDDINNPTSFTATNTPDRASGSYAGDVEYERTIKKTGDGLSVTSGLTTNEQDQFKSAWESLPIYISYDKNSNPVTSISYTTAELSGGPYSWSTLPETLTSNITAIRLGRDFGGGPEYIYLVPNDSIEAKLGSEWQANYQQSDYYQQLMINLHPNRGTAQTINSTSVSYDLQTTTP